MSKKRLFTVIFLVTLPLIQCRSLLSKTSLISLLEEEEYLSGRPEYLASPFVTAGDRAYMVGHQDGTFPPLGWHIPDEMGGVWAHPIKLLDGFTATILEGNQQTCLAAADSFINYPMANRHIYRQPVSGLQVERLQFVPDGIPAVCIEYTFKNTGNAVRRFTFSVAAHSDLRPTWLGERTNMEDSQDYATWDNARNAWTFKDSLNTWFAVVGSAMVANAPKGNKSACAYSPPGKGAVGLMNFQVTVGPGEEMQVPLTIVGSAVSQEDAFKDYQKVRANTVSLMEKKQFRYRELANNSVLNIPDPQMQTAFRWLKYSTDWLIRDVPGVGRGISAGLPDYPWWFGVDSEYTLQGALTIGRLDIVYETVELIHQLSQNRNGNGRIMHEASTNGAVFNDGNVNETPQFASLIWKVYQWTGNRQFLEKYFPTIQSGLGWLMSERDADGNLFPDGFGMMEIHGLDSEMIDVAVYTQKAFADAAEMAKELGKNEEAVRYREMAETLKEKINKEFWVPEFNSYADFIGTKQQALKLLDNAIIRADTLKKPWSVAELKATRQRILQQPDRGKRGFVLYHNWVVNTPMEVELADSVKAIKALNTAHKYTNPFGVFVTGLDRDESSEKQTGSFAKHMKVFTYTGAVMTLPTGVAAIGENNYGRPDEAYDYLQRLTRSFSYALPGSSYEVSPDFGMMTQAWTLYSYGIPIVEQFFGILPTASKKHVRVAPQMPEAWPEAELNNVVMADNLLNVRYARTDSTITLNLNQESPDWRIDLTFPAGKYKTWEVNGKTEIPAVIGNKEVFVLKDKENKVTLTLK